MYEIHKINPWNTKINYKIMQIYQEIVMEKIAFTIE